MTDAPTCHHCGAHLESRYAKAVRILQIIEQALSIGSRNAAPPAVLDGRLNPEWVTERARNIAQALSADDEREAREPVRFDDPRIT